MEVLAEAHPLVAVILLVIGGSAGGALAVRELQLWWRKRG